MDAPTNTIAVLSAFQQDPQEPRASTFTWARVTGHHYYLDASGIEPSVGHIHLVTALVQAGAFGSDAPKQLAEHELSCQPDDPCFQDLVTAKFLIQCAGRA